MPIHDWTKVYSGMFHDFHVGWSITIRNALNAGLLPKGMSALVEHKVGVVEPDVLAVDTWAASDGAAWGDRGGTAVLSVPATRIVRKSDKEHYAERANRIVVQQPLGRTIAVIELVSPGNKDGKRKFGEFVEKSREFIARGIHLLVVDVFPPTKRDPQGIHQAIWDAFEDDYSFDLPLRKNRVAVSYKAGRDEKAAYVETFAPGGTIPDMPLFLSEDFHVPVPLQSAYQTNWMTMTDELRRIVETGVLPGGGSAGGE